MKLIRNLLLRGLLLGALLGWAALLAQNFSGGLAIGFSATQVDGDGTGGFRKAGPSAGGFLQYRLDERWALQGELLYEQLGSATPQVVLLRAHYASLPLLLSRRFQLQQGETGRRHVLSAEAGPVVGALFQASDGFGADYTRALRRYDLRVVAGIGGEIGRRSALHLRYGYSAFSFSQVGSPLLGALFPNRPGLFHHYASLYLRYWLVR
jgi:hypothetical protein